MREAYARAWPVYKIPLPESDVIRRHRSAEVKRQQSSKVTQIINFNIEQAYGSMVIAVLFQKHTVTSGLACKH